MSKPFKVSATPSIVTRDERQREQAQARKVSADLVKAVMGRQNSHRALTPRHHLIRIKSVPRGRPRRIEKPLALKAHSVNATTTEPGGDALTIIPSAAESSLLARQQFRSNRLKAKDRQLSSRFVLLTEEVQPLQKKPLEQPQQNNVSRVKSSKPRNDVKPKASSDQAGGLEKGAKLSSVEFSSIDFSEQSMSEQFAEIVSMISSSSSSTGNVPHQKMIVGDNNLLTEITTGSIGRNTKPKTPNFPLVDDVAPPLRQDDVVSSFECSFSNVIITPSPPLLETISCDQHLTTGDDTFDGNASAFEIRVGKPPTRLGFWRP